MLLLGFSCRVYDIGIDVRFGQGRYRDTRIVTFAARYQLENRTQHTLVLSQSHLVREGVCGICSVNSIICSSVHLFFCNVCVVVQFYPWYNLVFSFVLMYGNIWYSIKKKTKKNTRLHLGKNWTITLICSGHFFCCSSPCQYRLLHRKCDIRIFIHVRANLTRFFSQVNK